MGLPNVNHAVHRSEVSEGLSLAYIREGVGGYPLLLIHGFPETKRIWYRNIGPLARAGFEVIVPDLRGFGDSDLSADGFYDPAAYAKDLCTLVHGVLGPPRPPILRGIIERLGDTLNPGPPEAGCTVTSQVRRGALHAPGTPSI